MHLTSSDRTYHDYLYTVLDGSGPIGTNYRPAARTAMATIGDFRITAIYDCSNGKLPVVTTKPIALKSQLVPEFVGFLRGEDNLKFYVDRKCRIWSKNGFDFYRKSLSESDEWSHKNLKKETPEHDQAVSEFEDIIRTDARFAAKNGSLGRIYGVQWRNWRSANGSNTDQLKKVIDQIKNNPFSRYHIVLAWNPGELKDMALAPCHMKFQFYAVKNPIDKEMDLHVSMDQRSCDSLLGVPYNFTFYSMMLSYVASQTGMRPGKVIHDLEDAHVYVGVGQRADFYRDNLADIVNGVHSARDDPVALLALRDKILKEAPKELAGTKGGDHIPFMLEQLSRESYLEKEPTISFDNVTIDEIDVGNVHIKGHKYRRDLELQYDDGEELFKPRMAG